MACDTRRRDALDVLEELVKHAITFSTIAFAENRYILFGKLLQRFEFFALLSLTSLLLVLLFQQLSIAMNARAHMC
jgi:hypothetical protein